MASVRPILLPLCLLWPLPAQDGRPPTRLRPAAFQYEAPAVAASEGGTLRELVERYSADRGAVSRYFSLPWSGATEAALRTFYGAWMRALEKLDFEKLPLDGRVDYILFRNLLERELDRLDNGARRNAEIRPLVPFEQAIASLHDARQRIEPLDPAKAANALDEIRRAAAALSARIPKDARDALPRPRPTAANRAARAVESMRETLRSWFDFYHGYDPEFTWWAADPYKKADSALESYSALVRAELAGLKKDDRDTILGDPIGRGALLSELRFEMIPYTPEELIAIAEEEFAWCDREMLRASRELGFGGDWKKALEHVKGQHVPPGRQVDLVRDLAMEAIEFVTSRGLVTVPPLARDTWRMQMMSAEAQRLNPFFLGGEAIIVSYPTGSMTHEEKRMSMRGNNIHAARATVQHELIPGHGLQAFMQQRYAQYRRPFSTPFWIEGWALHWEMLLWDLGFPRSAADRVGMLFWRMHRCARIIFSLNFHLEKMTAGQAVDFLVNRVGHELENARGEVRRSFESGFYGPLYQCAYMLGALQFRALHRELVGGGKMSNREFHDRILRLNSIPVELVRASLLGQAPPRGFTASWRFAGTKAQ
jgi:uncharacterized protein (DUF885 family)